MGEPDALAEFLDDLLGPTETNYQDIGIIELFHGDEGGLEAIEATLPVVDGRRVRSA